MVAFINSIVGGAGVTLLAGVLLGDDRRGLALGLGAVAAVAAMAAFLAFQRWRYSTW
jgi:hypothetical protein